MALVPEVAIASDGHAAERPDRTALDPPGRVLFPDDGPDDPASGPRLAGARDMRGRWGRWAAYGVVSLLAAAGVPAWYAILVSRPALAPVSRAVPVRAAPEAAALAARLDAAADSLGLAVAAFDLRGGLFARRQAGCPELAAGLAAVEERWLVYNGARRDASVLDTARDARDRSLYAQVDAVERRFEQSRCPRP
jgi:hypothetical protein